MLMTSKPWRAPAVSACRTATRVGRSGSRDICSDLTYVAFCWTDEWRERLQGTQTRKRLRPCRAEECESEARHQRKVAAGVGPRGQWKKVGAKMSHMRIAVVGAGGVGGYFGGKLAAAGADV